MRSATDSDLPALTALIAIAVSSDARIKAWLVEKTREGADTYLSRQSLGGLAGVALLRLRPRRSLIESTIVGAVILTPSSRQLG
jgi:hypothetical protein